MLQEEEIKKELEGLSQKLSSINKVNPFDIPEEYFDHLARDINHRISRVELKNTIDNTPSGTRNLPYIAAVAAMVLTVIAGIYLFKADKGITDVEAQLSKVPKKDIQKFIYNNIGEFDAYILLEDEFALLDNPLYLLDDTKITDEYIEEHLLPYINEIIIEEELL